MERQHTGAKSEPKIWPERIVHGELKDYIIVHVVYSLARKFRLLCLNPFTRDSEF